MQNDVEIVTTFEQTDWYSTLIDECRAIVTEAEFTSRWALVEGYHALGERILAENANFERSEIYGAKIVQRVAQSLQMSERTLYYAIQFARRFPDLSRFPASKNVSWGAVIREYLPAETKPRPGEKTFDLHPQEFKHGYQAPEPEWNDAPPALHTVRITCKNCGAIDSYEVP